MDLRRQAGGRAGQRGGTERRYLCCLPCRHTLNVPRGSLAPHELSCPLCNFQAPHLPSARLHAARESDAGRRQVVEVTTEQGRSFTFCPHCYANPPPDQLRDGASFASGFRSHTLLPAAPLRGRLKGCAGG